MFLAWLLFSFFRFCFPFNTSVHWRVRIRFDNGRCGEKKWKQRLRQRRRQRRRRCNSSSSSSTLAVSLCVCVRAFCALVYVWRAGSLSIEGLCGDGDVARKIQHKYKHTRIHTVNSNSHSRCYRPAQCSSNHFTSSAMQLNEEKFTMHLYACAFVCISM